MVSLTLVWGTVLFSALAALSWIDVRTLRLPDVLTLPLIALGPVQAWSLDDNVRDSLIGAAIGYLVFVLVEVGYRRLRGRDGLGRGDAKLLAAGGAWCGWIGLPWIVLIASGVALVLVGLLVLMRRHRPSDAFAFGPFLAIGIVAVWIASSVRFGPIAI